MVFIYVCTMQLTMSLGWSCTAIAEPQSKMLPPSSLTMASYGHDHILFAETYALFAATDTMPARGLGDTGSGGEAACYSAYLAYLCCVHDCTQASGNTTAQEGDRLQGRLLVDLSYTNFVYHSVL